MTLQEYQERAMMTCMPTSENFSYMMLNLVGEVGEFASKVAKAIRKDKACIYYNHLQTESGPNAMTKNEAEDLEHEAGDILWQLSGLCTVMGWNLEDVAEMNLEKLASRQERGKIDGNGDNR
jgi:NTP pyrophosphatase (non-canonical NTP hydrolase)